MVTRIQEFFKRVGPSRQALDDLMRYQASENHSFGVIKVSGQGFLETAQDGSHPFEKLVDNLAFFADYELSPLIVTGAGPGINEALPNSEKINGLRITSPDDMEVIKQVYHDQTARLIDKLAERGVNAYTIDDVLYSEKHPPVKKDDKQIDLGRVGIVCGIDFKKIKSTVHEYGGIPIILPIGIGEDGLPYNLNADYAAVALCKTGNIKKLVMVSDRPVQTKEGKTIHDINLRGQYHNLKTDGTLTGGMLLKVEQVFELLRTIEGGEKYTTQVTTLEHMPYELFGPGIDTQIALGYDLQTGVVDEQNVESVQSTITDVFKMPLQPQYSPLGMKLVYEANMKGLAVIKPEAVSDGNLSIAYMDKLVVLETDNGLGKDLLTEVINAHPNVFWRSNPDNIFNNEYMKNSQARINISVDGKPYYLFCNFDVTDNVDLLAKAVQYAQNQPDSFVRLVSD